MSCRAREHCFQTTGAEFMKNHIITMLCVTALVASITLSATARAETVSFPSADKTSISARLIAPPGAGPFPAIIGLHGCGGVNAGNGSPSAREGAWAQFLVARGYLVLLPDSYGSRGLGAQCTNAQRSISPSGGRTADVNGALAYLAQRRDVKPDDISLVGWSNGGSTVLYAMADAARSSIAPVDFRRAIAFYPGCRLPLQSGLKPRRPLLVLIGASDNWTPPGPCREFVDSARAAGRTADIVLYEGAYHGFDAPDSPVRERTGLAFTADGSGRAFVGTNPAARAKSFQDVAGFLSR